MSSAAVIILVALVTQGHGNDLAIETADSKNAMDNFVEQLIDRVLTVTPLNRADLDSMTMGKPAQSLSPARASLLPASRSSSYWPQLPMQGRYQNSVAAMRPNTCDCPVPPRIGDANTLVQRAKTAAMDFLDEVHDHPLPVIGKVSAAMVFSAMLVAAPAHADTATVVKDFTDAAYPIIGSLKKEAVGPLTGKAIQVALTANPKDIISTIDAGLEAFLSTDPTKFLNTVKALEVATTEASQAAKCNLVCLPTLETAEKVGAAAADALATADKEKISAFAKSAVKLSTSVDKFALAPLLIDGGKFAASLNPGDVAKASAAALEVVQSTSR
jgi:hypothetical protein